MLSDQMQQQHSQQYEESRFIGALKSVARTLQLPFDITAFMKKHVTFDRSDSKNIPLSALAQVHGDRIIVHAKILDALFAEMKVTAESESAAYTGLALRMALVLTHEHAHIQDREAQKKELGFSWPLSSLHAEFRGVAAEAKLFGMITKHTDLLEAFHATSRPRDYMMPGMSSSITEEFDLRIQTAHDLLKREDIKQFNNFVRNYYPQAIVLQSDNRKELELQLIAMRKVVTDPEERLDLEEAITICSSPDSYARLIAWYQNRGK